MLRNILMGPTSISIQGGAGQYINDTTLTSKVKAALFSDPDLKSTQISVDTFKGIVQLSGFSHSRAYILKAVELARGVQGVKKVENGMRLSR